MGPPSHYLVQTHPGSYVRVPVALGATQTAAAPFARATVVHSKHRVLALPSVADLADHRSPDLAEECAPGPDHLVCVEHPILEWNVHAGHRIHRQWFAVLAARGAEGTDDERILRELHPSVVETLLGEAAADHPEIAALQQAPKGATVEWKRAHPANPFDAQLSERETEAVVSAADGLWAERRAARIAHETVLSDGKREFARPLATQEAVLERLTTDPGLARLVFKAAAEHFNGYGGVDLVTKHTYVTAVLPCLLRLGYHATVFTKDDPGNDRISLSFAGWAPKLHEAIHTREHAISGGWDRGKLVFYGNSPKQLRYKGLIKCVPRLLGWLRAARIALVDPHADALAEAAAAGVEASELDAAGTTVAERHAADQAGRKRKLVDAIHADEANVEEGCRWAGIKKRRPGARIRPMRIEAVHGDVFCFATHSGSTDAPNAIVELLHRDEFDVAWQTINVGAAAVGTPWNGRGLEPEYVWRRTADYYQHVHLDYDDEDDYEDDEDDDEGEEDGEIVEDGS